MITIVRGSGPDVSRRCADLAAHARRPVYPIHPVGTCISWHGVRCLVAHLGRRLGEAAVRDVIASRKAAASLVLHECLVALSGEERAERETLRARVDSNLSHNAILSDRLVRAWASILVELASVAGNDFVVLIPDVGAMDRETLRVLRKIYGASAESLPDLIVGHDPSAQIQSLDRHGLSLQTPLDFIAGVVLGLQTFAGAQVVDVVGTGQQTGSEDPLDGQESRMEELVGGYLEYRAVAALAHHAGPPEPELSVLVLRAMRSAFDNFGFTAAARLGRELVRRAPLLDPDQAAEVHGLLGLATHNLQLHSGGNLGLAHFLEREFRAAWSAERRHAERACLCYRMAVTLGRRQGQIDAALDWANRSISEARHVVDDPIGARYLHAWGLNIRAYLLMRAGDAEAATHDMETAFSIVEEAMSVLAATEGAGVAKWRTEIPLTAVVLAENSIFLAQLSDDLERRKRWQDRIAPVQALFPGTDRLKAHDRFAYYSRLRRLDLALSAAVCGMEAAREERDALWLYYFIFQAGEMHYRLGRPDVARGFFERAATLRRQWSHPQMFARPELPAAAACIRCGRWQDARVLLESILADGADPPGDRRSEILAQLGLLAALQEDSQAADATMNQAIELAVASGKQETLLRVALAAGNACRALGRTDSAHEAFRRAVEIASTYDPTPPSVAGELMAALLGLFECGDRGGDIGRRCLSLLPEALDTGETWCELPRLLALLIEEKRTGAVPWSDLLHPLENLVTAASVRSDCAALLRELLEVSSEARSARELANDLPLLREGTDVWSS